jgi:nucleoside-diphosphate-sugar epimerase
MRSLRRFDDEFATTNRLRTEGTEYLLAAARECGATRFLAQSYTGWPNVRTGGRVKSETDPLDPDPPKAMSRSLEAIRQLETMVCSAAGLSGIVLRYGSFYGPETSTGEGGEIVEMVKRRQLPVFGGGAGVWSFIHIDDAARATMLAIERGMGGKYNIVDDEPVEVSVWLPALAAELGAKPPYHLPGWVGRIVIGEAGLSMMTQSRGSSNLKAKRELGWRLEFPTWREGFRIGLKRSPAGIAK